LANVYAKNVTIKWAFSESAAVLEIAELREFQLRAGIFLQSFVLRRFSIVWKSAGLEEELAEEAVSNSNLSRTSENKANRNSDENCRWACIDTIQGPFV
jgi:hypothetical protein